jgi:hypothetical protein
MEISPINEKHLNVIPDSTLTPRFFCRNDHPYICQEDEPQATGEMPTFFYENSFHTPIILLLLLLYLLLLLLLLLLLILVLVLLLLIVYSCYQVTGTLEQIF